MESSLEGGDSLCGHIEQAKGIIAKIKFINHKIVEFQNNGMSTKQLIAQKKNLEEELMKKKIIVDNSQTGTEVLVLWKTRVENLTRQIKNSEASEIEKALLDMQLNEAVDNINTHIIALEKNSRRTGVLFKTVKELEATNDDLANENSFLKQRLSKLDKPFKEIMNKKILKLDNALEELGDIKHLQSNEHGTKADDVSRAVKRGGVSLEMELIDNYQEQIHILDGENKDLIAKIDNLEAEIEEYKEELKALEAKLKNTLKEQENVKNSEIVAAHPLVKLDTDETYSLGAVSTTMFSDGNMSMSRSGVSDVKRRNTVEERNRRESAMVSTITMQDGKELEFLKNENEKLRAQLGKVKHSLNTVRRQSIKPRVSTKRTQTVMLVPSSESEENEESSQSSDTDVQEVVKANEKPQGQKSSRPSKANKQKKREIKVTKREKAAVPDKPPVSDSSELSPSSEEEVEQSDPKITEEEIAMPRKSRAESMVANLKSFVKKQERERRRSERKKKKENATKNAEPQSEKEVKLPSEASSTEIETESEEEIELKEVPSSAELMAKKKNKPKKKKVKRYSPPKRHVKFKESKLDESEQEIQTFQRVNKLLNLFYQQSNE